MNIIKSFFKKYPISILFIELIIDLCALELVRKQPVIIALITRLLLALKSYFLVKLIAGDKVKGYWDIKNALYVISRLKPFWIFAFVVGSLSFSSFMLVGTPLIENWFIKFAFYFFFMLTVGLFEEMTFRVVINESILYQFKDDKNVFKYIGIATVLIFGVVHIIGSDITSFISLATAILKVLSAGLIGLTFMFMFWKKKNILGCVLTHAFYDFFSAISTYFFVPGMELKTSYVNDGNVGIVTIVVYLGMIAWTVYILNRLWKSELKDFDFEKLKDEM